MSDMLKYDDLPMIMKIISGGQTGIDQMGLVLAKELGLRVGGTAPKGYKTENGPNYELRDVYGLDEDESPLYPPRTEKNVVNSDMTVIISAGDSAGCNLTRELCKKHKKPYVWIDASKKIDEMDFYQYLTKFIKAMEETGKKDIVLNVAGNRESICPGLSKPMKIMLEALILGAQQKGS